jgi:hypothetical protein
MIADSGIIPDLTRRNGYMEGSHTYLTYPARILIKRVSSLRGLKTLQISDLCGTRAQAYKYLYYKTKIETIDLRFDEFDANCKRFWGLNNRTSPV